MSSAVKYLPRYNVSDYQQWEGDWELLDGVAVAMTPTPGGPHQAWEALLTAKFVVALGKDKFHELIVLPEIDWIINRHTVVRPDLVIIQGQIPAGHLKHPPVLIVEILSPATTGKDRGAKFELYQR